MTDTKRPIRVFLCHSSGDKPTVIELYERLVKDGIDAWLDKEKLIPGQDLEVEIPKAVKNSDIVIVCLSSQSVTKEGFVQKEIKFALDLADEKPEGTIFIIPARLEDCDVPERIKRLHWVDLFSNDGYERLLNALQIRAESVGAKIKRKSKTTKSLTPKSYSNSDKSNNNNIELTGTWELQEDYEFGITTGVLNLIQNGSLLSGAINIYDRMDDGDEYILQQEVQGTIQGKSVSLTGIKVKILKGDPSIYELDKWTGNLENNNLISGFSEDRDGISGKFTLTRSTQK
jgi:hypothetical protein